MLESKNLTVQTEGELCYITIPAFEKTGLVRHCFTTRLGGVSPEPYGMNLGISGADVPENVRRNYEKIAYAIGSFPGNLVVSAQVHGTEILRVGVLDRSQDDPKNARGLWLGSSRPAGGDRAFDWSLLF